MDLLKFGILINLCFFNGGYGEDYSIITGSTLFRVIEVYMTFNFKVS